MNNWRDIWAKRTPHGDAGSTLISLLREDGYDTLGAISEDSWRKYVARTCARLQIEPGDSVYDVGCGAGALLWCLRESGHPVGGIDYSARQIARAKQTMPDVADLHVGEAATMRSSRAGRFFISRT